VSWVLAAVACGKAPPPAATEPAAIEAAPPPRAEGTGAAAVPASSVAPAATAASWSPRAPELPPGPRIYAKSRFAWIAPAPGRNAWFGYLSLGGSVAVRGASLEEARVGGGGSCDAWYRVEPRGVVCVGRDATTDANDPTVVALAANAPRLDSPWPFDYGESIGAPRYDKLPTAREQGQREALFDEFRDKVRRARGLTDPDAIGAIDKHLIGIDLQPTGIPAPTLFEAGPRVREPRKAIARASTVAYTRAFDADDRSWLLTSDHALMPRDKVRPYPRSSFQGIHLDDGDKKLPIAFFRKKPRPKYRRDQAGGFVPTGEDWAVRTWVGLTGESVEHDEKKFYATREAGVWASEDDATVVRGSDEPPKVVGTSERNTWVEVSVIQGWLIAYEGKRPVFVTLISPGRGLTPVPGKDPLETASTPTGIFRVDGKFRTATMVSSTNENIVHSDVMYVQNFHGPHSLHGAYWHDAWGEGKSGGCINLSPIDSKWLFEWTEPAVPEGWHGLRSTSEAGPATTVVVHR
jgi:hypothetical protein